MNAEARLLCRLALLGSLLLPTMPLRASGQSPFRPPDHALIDRLISFDADSSIFPELWRREPFYADAEPIAESQKLRARRIVAQALERYPAELLERTLQQVYLVGSLHFYEPTERQHFGGTAHSWAVYLVVKPESEGYSDDYLATTFHREFSTTLLNRHLDRVDFDAWGQANGKDFQYLGGSSWERNDVRGKEGGARAIDRKATSLSLSEDKGDLERGFLTDYSKSSIENDFNEYAARLFRGQSRLWQLAGQHPAAAKKRDLTIAFYRSLHPALDASYFRQLANGKR